MRTSSGAWRTAITRSLVPASSRHQHAEVAKSSKAGCSGSWHLGSDFASTSVELDGSHVVLLEIDAAFRHPVQFEGSEYIRIGSYKKRLKDYPEKERALWRTLDATPFELQAAAEKLGADEVLKLLDYPAYFDLLAKPLPNGRDAVLEALSAHRLVEPMGGGHWRIFNLGALLFAKNLPDFPHLQRKAVRVVVYQGTGRVLTLREQEGRRGYAAGFEGLIGFVNNLLPMNEVVGQALRRSVPKSTRATLFAPRPLSRMDRDDRIRAVYLHACLRHVQREHMTNTSLRQRFGIEPKNSAIASRLLKEALAAGTVRLEDARAAPKMRRYVPYWA